MPGGQIARGVDLGALVAAVVVVVVSVFPGVVAGPHGEVRAGILKDRLLDQLAVRVVEVLGGAADGEILRASRRRARVEGVDGGLGHRLRMVA